MSHKTIIALTAVVALGWVPFSTNTLAASQPGGGHSVGHAMGGHAMGARAMSGHAMGGHSRYARGDHGARYGAGYYGNNGPIYDTCDGYSGNGCPGFGVPFVGGMINGVLGGY